MNQLNRYFKILGLEPDAALEEARQAYRALVRTWHPDRFGDDPSLQLRAQERLKEINEAYHVVHEVISSREEVKPGASPYPASFTKTPSPDCRAPSSTKPDKPPSRPEGQPITPLFYFWPNVLLFLLALAGLRISWQRYGLSMQGFGYLLQITSIPLVFAVVCNARLGCSRRLWTGYVAAVLLFATVIAVDTISYNKEISDSAYFRSFGERDASDITVTHGGGVAEMPAGSSLPPSERRVNTGPMVPAAPLAPTAPVVPAAPMAPAAPFAPRAR